MDTINIKGDKAYNIYLDNSFKELNKLIQEVYGNAIRICIIADERVSKIYSKEITDSLSTIYKDIDLLELTLDENHKNLDTVDICYKYLLNKHYTRNDLIIALGGGICLDLVGFVSATYKRGINHIYIPTTLLSMVDAGIGGKTGVNYGNLKNIIGAFCMPDFVYINSLTLKTLPPREYASGIAECLKSGLIKNSSFYEWMINNFNDINDYNEEALHYLISQSILIKKYYVEKDPYEKNERAILNFGHTLGHALEKYTDFSYTHGECVALGMVCAAFISWKKEYISMDEYYEIRDMFVPFNLPITLDSIDYEKILSYTLDDKKNGSNERRFILLKKVGKGIISTDVTDEEMLNSLKEIDFNSYE